jgi:hypothetical protein
MKIREEIQQLSEPEVTNLPVRSIGWEKVK